MEKASGKATMTSGITAMNMRTDWDGGLRGSGRGYRTLRKKWEEGNWVGKEDTGGGI